MKAKIHLILTAIILIAVGVICIIYPNDSLGPLTWLLGVLVLASGCFTILFSLRAQNVLPNASSSTLLGVFQIMLGTLFILSSFGRLKDGAIGVLFATWVMFEGLSLLISSFGYKKAKFQSWWIMLLLGLLSVILGYLALLNADKISVVLAIFIGIGIVANGVVRIIAFIAISRIEKQLKEANKFDQAEILDNQSVNNEK